MIYYKIKCKYTLEEEKDEKRLKRLWEDINNDYEYGEHAMKLYIYEGRKTGKGQTGKGRPC